MSLYRYEGRLAEAEARGQAALERALTLAFWDALERGPLPPMAALEAAARTVGTLYRQIASLHGPAPRCGCGWQLWLVCVPVSIEKLPLVFQRSCKYW